MQTKHFSSKMRMVTFSGEVTFSKLFLILSEKGFTLKIKNLVHLRANYFLLSRSIFGWDRKTPSKKLQKTVFLEKYSRKSKVYEVLLNQYLASNHIFMLT